MNSNNKGKKFPPEYLTQNECLALMDACGPKDNAIAMRHRALIVLLWRSGLRLAEALALRTVDIDQTTLSVRVLHGKGDKARTTATDAQALEVINDWLAVRDRRWKVDRNAPIICTHRGSTLKQSYVRRLFPLLAYVAGVNRRVHAHVFRHTFAVELSRDNVPVRDIQQLLGHTSLATTSVYLASLSPEESLKHVRGRTWRRPSST
jgi:site-specific recombinase XerD